MDYLPYLGQVKVVGFVAALRRQQSQQTAAFSLATVITLSV